MENQRAILDKLATHFVMEEKFPSEGLSLHKVEQDLATVDSLIEQLESGELPPTLQTEAKALIKEYQNDEEVQNWCGSVLREKAEISVQIPHAKRIEEFPHPIEIRNSAEDRIAVAEAYQFRFDGFSTLLDALGFWERIGPQLEKVPQEKGGMKPGSVDWSSVHLTLDHELFSQMMNVLNSSAQIDYEGAFPEQQEWFDLLKSHKYGLDTDAIAQKKETFKSPLNVPDILSILVIDRLNKEAGIDGETQGQTFELNSRMLDDKVSYDERIRDHEQLKQIYQNIPDTDFSHVLQTALDQLALPEGFPGKIQSVDEIKRVDVVIPLVSGDDGLNAYLARSVVHHAPHSFMMPTGGFSPHEHLSNKPKSNYTEADLMNSMALGDNLPEIYPWQYPETIDLSSVPSINPYDILAPDTEANSTVGNALYSTKRLKVLQEHLEKDHIDVVVVTNNFHSSRSIIDFYKAASKEEGVNPHVSILENTQCPLLMTAVQDRKMHAFQNSLGEYVKHLYMVSQDNVAMARSISPFK